MKKRFSYGCDCGALKVGGKDFSILIGNDFGDGGFHVHIGVKHPTDARFQMAFQGKDLKVFDYDCSGGKPSEGVSLTGSFMAYALDGDVYIEKLSDESTYWGDNV